MLDTIINKIRSLENTTLILGGIGIILLVVLVAYMSKRSKPVASKPDNTGAHLQGQDCFAGVCKVPPHIKETLTSEEQVPIPVEPVLSEVQQQPVEEVQQQPVEEVQQQPVEEVQQPVEEVQQPVEEVQQQPIEEVEQQQKQSIDTTVLEEPMN
jgi:outer membrane biosynthesis protein TonB